MKRIYKFMKSYLVISLVFYITGVIINANWFITEWYVTCRAILAFAWCIFIFASSQYPHDNN